MLIKMAITQLVMGLFKNSVTYMSPRSLSIRKRLLFPTSQRARVEWVLMLIYLSVKIMIGPCMSFNVIFNLFASEANFKQY